MRVHLYQLWLKLSRSVTITSNYEDFPRRMTDAACSQRDAACSQRIMAPIDAGELVFVRVVDPTKQEYNTVLWRVEEILGARLHLKATLPSTGCEQHISVAQHRVSPATLACAASVPQSVTSFGDLMQNAIVHHTGGFNAAGWDPSPFLDQWIRLPLLGGNYILLRRSEPNAHLPLVMYPRINEMRLELWFHSHWLGQSMQLQEVDGLKLCPQHHIWPYCQWCRKFHLPYDGQGSHRCSKDHGKFSKNYMHGISTDVELSCLRDECNKWSLDMWL